MIMSSLLGNPKSTRSMPSLEMNKVKILVLGESGVGKTAFVQTAAGNPVRNSPWTVGASVEVLVHMHKAGTQDESAHFVELWDIGGSRSHMCARRVFYQSIHGLILVHDLSNRKSEEMLRSWISEALQPHVPVASNLHSPLSYDLNANNSGVEQLMGEPDIPMLFVGAKLDLVSNSKSVHSPSSAHNSVGSVSVNVTPNTQSTSRASRLYGGLTHNADEIALDCRQPINPGSTNSMKFTKFLDKVVDQQEKRRQGQTGLGLPTTAFERRRRLAFP